MEHVDIYTDGSCLGNPGNGGWATILTFNNKEKELYGSEPNTTNNRMELTAVIEGLAALKRACEVYVYTDSKYVSDAINKGWLKNWAETAFYGRKNSDLWKTLLGLLSQHTVTFIWVKGHNGNVYNERCDKLAVSQSKSIESYDKTYKKMEFTSDKEALEWAGLNGIQIESMIYSEYGVEMKYADNGLEEAGEAGYEEEPKEYIIGALTDTGGTMYITAKGTSFNINDAKRFYKNEATSKATAMRKNSKRDYEWKAIKV